MTRIAYLDCFSGVAGDMLLGAVIDAGVPAAWVRKTVKNVVPQFTLSVKKAKSGGLGGALVKVGYKKSGQPRRGLSQIEKMIRNSGLPGPVVEKSVAVFTRLAEAEAKVHRVGLSHIHFHEVGAVDAIVDVVGTIAGLHRLAIEDMVCSPLPMGGGEIECAHGILPSPAPATLELIRGVPVHGVDLDAELVTPTGAALATTLASSFGAMPAMTVNDIGVGIGHHDLGPRPNLARLIVGEAVGGADRAVQIEAAIDDMPPERFDFLMDRLHRAGALEVMFIPAQMKKNRPGTLVRALAPAGSWEAVAAELFNHSTTLGVRTHEVFRSTLERRTVGVSTPLGKARVKLARRPDGSVRRHVEYDDLKRMAERSGKSIEEVERQTLDEFSRMEESK